MKLLFYTDIFLENELRPTSLSFSCVLQTRFSFVINRLFYDACFAEKSQDLIFPRASISFDSIGFYNTFRFSALRSRDFVPEEMVDIWVTIARAVRDSMVGFVSTSCLKI